jgi:hypothetical protein
MLKRLSTNARIRRIRVHATGDISQPRGHLASLNGVSSSMKLIRWSVLCVVIAALLGASAVSIYRFKLKRSAEDVVRVSYGLSLQRQPPTVQELRERFGRALRQPDPCTPDGCGYDVFLSNLSLAEVHLLPYTALRSSFWAKNGVVESNSLELWTTTRKGSWALSYVLVKYCDQCNSFMINPWEDSSPLGTTGSVEIGSVSTAGEKRTALAFNTECLTSWRGCTNIAELMPNIWWVTPARTIGCRIRNRGGDVERARNQP